MKLFFFVFSWILTNMQFAGTIFNPLPSSTMLPFPQNPFFSCLPLPTHITIEKNSSSPCDYNSNYCLHKRWDPMVTSSISGGMLRAWSWPVVHGFMVAMAILYLDDSISWHCPHLLTFTFFLPSPLWCSLCFRREEGVPISHLKLDAYSLTITGHRNHAGAEV